MRSETVMNPFRNDDPAAARNGCVGARNDAFATTHDGAIEATAAAESRRILGAIPAIIGDSK